MIELTIKWLFIQNDNSVEKLKYTVYNFFFILTFISSFSHHQVLTVTLAFKFNVERRALISTWDVPTKTTNTQTIRQNDTPSNNRLIWLIADERSRYGYYDEYESLIAEGM